MKTKNTLSFLLIIINTLNFQTIIPSTQDHEKIDNIMALMDEKTAKKILTRFHEQQTSSLQTTCTSEKTLYGVTRTTYAQLQNRSSTSTKKYKSEPEFILLKNSLNDHACDFEYNLTEEQTNQLSAALGVDNRDEETKKREQKIFLNDIYSKGFGVAAICAALNTGAIINVVLGNPEQKRVFVIDDLLALAAAKSAWSAVVPSLISGVAAIAAWRQFDHWIHGEERERCALLEKKFNTKFSDIEKSVALKFVQRDKEATTQQKEMHEYVDKIIETLQKQLKTLSNHCDEQTASVQKLVQEMSKETQEKNDAITELINNAHANINKARDEMAGIQATITALKETNGEMKLKLAEMSPFMQKIYQATQNILQSNGVAPVHQLVKIITPQEALANIQIPQCDNNDNEIESESISDNSATNIAVAANQIEILSKDADNIFKKNKTHSLFYNMTHPFEKR